MAPAAQNLSFVNTPRTHLPVEGGSSTVKIQASRGNRYEKETGVISRSAKAKIPKATLKPFPTGVFVLLIVIDIIDIFMAMTWVGSVLFNIVVGIFVSKYVMDRIGDYKKTLDRIISLAESVSKLGGKSLGTRVKRMVARILKKSAGKALTKKVRRRIYFFVLYGLVPILQIFASWAFFLFMYYKQEKKLVDEINEAAETVAQAQAEAAATVRVSLQ